MCIRDSQLPRCCLGGHLRNDRRRAEPPVIGSVSAAGTPAARRRSARRDQQLCPSRNQHQITESSPRRPGDGAVLGRADDVDRQRGTSAGPRRTRPVGRVAVLGRQRLCPALRRPAVAGRAPRGRLRAATRLPGGPRPVHRFHAGRRAGRRRGHAHRRAGRAGSRCGRAGPHGVGAGPAAVPGRSRTGRRNGCLGCRLRCRRSGRGAARRPAQRGSGLAIGIPGDGSGGTGPAGGRLVLGRQGSAAWRHGRRVRRRDRHGWADRRHLRLVGLG